MFPLIRPILFNFDVSFGKAQRAARCDASGKRCNAAKRRQNQTLWANAFCCLATSKSLSVIPFRPADFSWLSSKMRLIKGNMR
jgi:hypothetical protein|tara:strand:- start:401 stop:649 length:249 start_codon:yes stop_codon:yes gene_type:complete